MRTSKAILLVSCANAVRCWSYSGGYSGGLYYPNRPEQQQILSQASQHPNATTSVPVALAGGHNMTFRINITDLALPGVDTDLSNPRAVLTTFDVTWPAPSTFNDTFENPGPSCFTTVTGSFSKSVTKKAQSDGDCTSPFGEDCVSALQQSAPDCNTPLGLFPDACKDAFKTTGNSFAYELGDKNGTEPLAIYARNSGILTPDEIKGQYKDVAEEMYFALFRNGERPSVPVCVRVTSAAALVVRLSTLWIYAIAALVVGWSWS